MKVGIHRISMSEYLTIKALSSGVLHTLMSQSPLHARINSPWGDKRDTSASKEADTGSAAHKLLLEGNENGIAIIDADDWRTKVAKEARDAAYRDGQIPMLAHKMAAVRAMADAAREFVSNSEISMIFESGEPELTMVWDESGTLCKARSDWLNKSIGVHLSYKTTDGSANPKSWIRNQLPDYDMAMLFYERGIKATTGIETVTVHLVQEQRFPYACSLIGLDPAYRGLAEYRLDKAMSAWKACEASGKWSAYSERIHYAEPAAWQITDVEFDNEEMLVHKLTKEELAWGIPA